MSQQVQKIGTTIESIQCSLGFSSVLQAVFISFLGFGIKIPHSGAQPEPAQSQENRKTGKHVLMQGFSSFIKGRVF